MNKYIVKNWYWLISVCLWAIAASIILLVILDGYFSYHIPNSTGEMILGFSTILLATGIPWTFWICPVFRSRTPIIRKNTTPKDTLNDLLLWTSFIFFICCVLSFFFIGIRIAEDMTLKKGINWLGVINVAIICIAVNIPIFLITWLLCRTIDKRFKAAIIRLNLCFECGYDLQGSTSPTCPECGHPIPGREEKQQVDPAVPDTE